MGIGLAVIAKTDFGTASAFGFLMSAFAVGSLAGMFGAGLVPRRRRGRTLLLTGSLIGLCIAPIGFLSRMTTLIPDLALLSAAAAFLNIQLISWFQQRVDRAVMGRVMSVLMFAAVGLRSGHGAPGHPACRFPPRRPCDRLASRHPRRLLTALTTQLQVSPISASLKRESPEQLPLS